MLAPLDLITDLRARLRDGLHRLPPADPAAPGLVSLILPLPVAPELPPEIEAPRFGLIHGRRRSMRAGYGIAAEWLAQGPGRLDALRGHAESLRRQWLRSDPDDTGLDAFALLGFAADPLAEPRPDSDTGLPNALLWVPEAGLIREGSDAALVMSAPRSLGGRALAARWDAWLARLAPTLGAARPEPLTPGPLRHLGSSPNLSDWQRLVRATLAQIEHGDLRKAVLCRRVGLQARRPFDPVRLQAALTWLFPACQVIRLARGRTSFVAATPERLVRVAGPRAEVDAIAGTAARSASAEQDRALTALLQASDKDAREHALVVRAVERVLAECCTGVQVPTGPRVLQLHNAQHLWSPLSGRLRPGHGLLDLALRLHPTPATNGEPRGPARDWLRDIEPAGRGWYTGAAGVLGPDLQGELWVLLRSAEVAGDTAWLHAGAGIVRGSDPLAEWRETGHKLSAMATALRFA